MDWKYLLYLIPTACYVFLRYLTMEVVPDYCGLHLLNPKDYFELILTITASIIGILIAVVLLVFQMSKNKYLRRKDENLATKPNIIIVLTLSLSILILGFASYVTLDGFLTRPDLNIGYFIGFLFVGFLITVFPTTNGILSDLNVLKKSQLRISKLTVNDFFDGQNPNNYLNLSPDHPLSRVREDLLQTIHEADHEGYTGIIFALNQKIITLIDNAQDRRRTSVILMGMTYIWRESNMEAIKSNIHQFGKAFWDSIGGLYFYAAKIKAPLLHFQEIEDFLHRHIEFSGRRNMTDMLSFGVDILYDAFEKNLTENRPDQKGINNLYDLFDHTPEAPYDIDSSMQWDYIVNIIDSIYQTQDISIINRDLYLFNLCQFHTNRILSDMSHRRYGPLGQYQEGGIALSIMMHSEWMSHKAIDAGLFSDTLGNYEINTSFTTYAIEEKKLYTKEIISRISDFLINSQRKACLNSYHLTTFGATGRRVAKLYNENRLAKETIAFIVQTLETIKKEIEDQQLKDQIINYNEVKTQLVSQKSFLLRDNQDIDNDPIINQIDSILRTFKSTAYKSESNIVKWQ